MSARSIRLLSVGVFVAVVVALYGFTLPFPFIFDDHIYLVNNPLATDARSFYFMGDFHAFANHSKGLGLDQDLSTNFILRPFAYLTFYLNYLAGGMNPPGFRVVNIAIHCGNAVLLFALVSRLFRHTCKGGHAPDSAMFIGMSSALLFLVHPLQIESVTYVIQRFTSFGTSFYLFTVLTFVMARTSEHDAIARRWRRWSIAGLLVGMLTKEFVFTAPFMMVLLDWAVLGAPVRAACRRAVPWFLCLPLIPILIVITSIAQSEQGASFGAILNVAGPKDQPADYSFHYALTQPSVVLTYLRLILVPRGLNLDPDFPACTSLFDWRFLGSMGLILAIVVASWVCFRKWSGDARCALVFCFVVWTFLTLSIDSSIVPLPDLMAEHRSYLPSIGVLGALACLADIARTRLLERPHLRWAVPTFVAVWILALAVATIERNKVWSSNVRIWSDTVAKSPNKWRPWKNRGVAHFFAGEFESSAACYRRAIEINPAQIEAYVGLANCEIVCGRFRETIEVSQAGLRVRPHPLLSYFLGVAHHCIGDEEKAVKALRAGIALHPGHGPSHVLLAAVCARRGDYDQAMQHSRIATAAGSLSPEHWKVLAEVEHIARIRASLPKVP